ncbi:ATP-dependent RecD-like DNA helicase [Myxococcota bacterium]|nr:ATP-dependent RecD-like DNA helicase [Myxococcota bacterium]MBU1900537.1 ATP-dependent RecD-like DNA helicase [Myxococcota bacterium]
MKFVPTEEIIEGILERFVFTNDDESFAVAMLRPDSGSPVRVVGPLTGLQVGERVRLKGRNTLTLQHGAQFKVSSGYPLLPLSREGILAYLSSGRIRGIGPSLAKRLVDRFGPDTLKIIQEQPEQLSEVPGIGPKRCLEIQDVLTSQQAHRETLVYLQGHGVSVNLSNRIWKRYQAQAVTIIRQNPYRLAQEMSGIGFITADKIARAVGFEEGDPLRVGAALIHLLKEAAGEGHVYLPRETLLERAEALLHGLWAPARLDELLAAGKLIQEGDAVYLRRAYENEVEIGLRVRALLAREVEEIDTTDLDDYSEIDLDPRQREAVEQACARSFLLITGGPGTGKTTIIHALTLLFGEDVALAAPTGRAARRLAEATDMTAKTLHRLLEYTPAAGGFRRDEENPLEAGVIIIDEVSMIDQALFLALLRALPPDVRLILVGDADQLPSVGAGQILSDLLSGGAPSVRLTRVFRQARESQIVVNAHRILSGYIPTSPEGASDFYVVSVQDSEQALDVIGRLVTERIPKRFGFDPTEDIQVLTPMHRGVCGAERLNFTLQAQLNPDGALIADQRAFRVGDKVMQVRNDYDKEVFNGDLGRIVARVDEGAIVAFDARRVLYRPEELNDLLLAYACSVHKSQGSEYPAVIVPILNEHWIMQQRNLLYTAVTRGRSLVIIVGQTTALRRAVKNDGGLSRYTGLAKRLGNG